ncbi:integral membrane protein [Colletotrichum tofieldiae]|uniref:Integral membrane protein n=1 Tax=Colletotrichum tofieldiae TaxID=708197 RepID=A0A166LWK5_9PEZI|nr:integral membrane protein [Colletotrichum tofieldiae]GKT61766.1 integral membrane protein [Colletotrichum tofieldiae]GKT70179.1 integral membrane protein [Colletotrichum tofieldiae]GKT93226.1 integral membrane protein [Colletotrichum tofieldiae]
MNTFNPRRVSYLRPPTTVFEVRESWASPYPSLSSIGYPPSERSADERFASAVWHRTFNHVDYAAYKAACDAERAAKPDRDADVFSVNSGPARRGLSRIGAMLTIYPYRDMGWLVTMVFLMAAICLSLNGIFSLIHLLNPQLDFPGRETGTQVTFVLGSSLLTLSAWMGLLAAFNVDRATLDPKKDAPDAYKPALLGSDEWVWWSSWYEFRNIFWPSTAFRAGILQLLAGSFFTIAAVGALPGVLDLTHPNASIIFVSSPQLIGGSFFVLAGLLMIFLSQNKWYVPLLLDASWQNGFWNLVGASGFLAVGVVTLLDMNAAVTIASLLLMSGLGFLLASLIQWYIIMEFYPVDPYVEDPIQAAEIPSHSIY